MISVSAGHRKPFKQFHGINKCSWCIIGGDRELLGYTSQEEAIAKFT